MMHKTFILVFGLIFHTSVYAISFEYGLKVLNSIKTDVDFPDNKINNATITIVDEDFITAKIKCEILIKKDKEPTFLKDNVLALFYDEGVAISKLKADIATYQENFTLKANRNISIYNLDTKDSLFFVNQDESEITWDENYGRIKSDKEFILKTNDVCTLGSSFESDVDLTNIKIVGIKGTSHQGPCNK